MTPNNSRHSTTHLARWLLFIVCLVMMGFGTANANERLPERLTIGEEVRGEITSADHFNYNDGSRSKLYRFTAEPGELVAFQVSGALKAQLALYVDGEQVAASNDEAARLSYRVDSARTHLLAVSGEDNRAYGPFRLSSQTLALYSGDTLIPDVDVHDWLGIQPREISLQIDRAGLYRLDMTSDEFDTKLELSGHGHSYSNDDGGEGSNSRLIVELAPGRYTLRPLGYDSGARGLYRLSVVAYTLPGGQLLSNGGVLVLDGPELTGLLSGSERAYILDVERRQQVSIDMRSEMFDAFLRLNGQGVSREDDDGGEHLNARIRAILEPGRYQVTASATGNRSNAGLFTLAATGRDIPEGSGGGALTIGQTGTAELLSGMPNLHTFSVRRAGAYVIEMRSDDVDSHLRLYRDGEEIDSDDDSGRALDARIERHLQPGAYVIEASSVGEDGGRYQIEVRQR